MNDKTCTKTVTIAKLETDMEKVEKQSSANCKMLKTKVGLSIFFWIIGAAFIFTSGAYIYTHLESIATAQEIEGSKIDAKTVCKEAVNHRADITELLFRSINGKLDTIIEQNKEIKIDLKDHNRRIDKLEWGNDNRLPN